MSRILFFISMMLFVSVCTGQDSTSYAISGHAFDSSNPSRRLDDLMIINLRTSQGVFGKADGSFNVVVHRTDTILVASTGYEYRRVPMTDSILNHLIYIQAPLVKLNIKLKEVTIFSPRDLESIYKEIEKLGYSKKDYELEGINALQSPITFLYQEFSRLERLKRHNAELINNDKRRELLRQLLINYVSADIINLDNTEFDDFISFCNVPEEFMKKATQYDFCIYIKREFEQYRLLRGVRKG